MIILYLNWWLRLKKYIEWFCSPYSVLIRYRCSISSIRVGRAAFAMLDRRRWESSRKFASKIFCWSFFSIVWSNMKLRMLATSKYEIYIRTIFLGRLKSITGLFLSTWKLPQILTQTHLKNSDSTITNKYFMFEVLNNATHGFQSELKHNLNVISNKQEICSVTKCRIQFVFMLQYDKKVIRLLITGTILSNNIFD